MFSGSSFSKPLCYPTSPTLTEKAIFRERNLWLFTGFVAYIYHFLLTFYSTLLWEIQLYSPALPEELRRARDCPFRRNRRKYRQSHWPMTSMRLCPPCSAVAYILRHVRYLNLVKYSLNTTTRTTHTIHIYATCPVCVFDLADISFTGIY